MDILYIALTFVLFAASWGFVRLCESLASAPEERK
jgi:flagellar biogenesis protein FliO